MDNPFLAKIPLMDFERTPPIFNCVLKKKTQKFKKKKTPDATYLILNHYIRVQTICDAARQAWKRNIW